MTQPPNARPRGRVAAYFGRRGGFLVVFGLIWVFLGIRFATEQQDRFSRPGGPNGPLEFMDSTPWPGLFWVACGVVAVINGLVRRRWHNEDALGYAALVMPPVLWSAAYLVSYSSYLYSAWVGEVPTGRGSAYLSALVFGLLVVAVRVIATWPDEMDLPEVNGIRGSAELAMLDRLVETHDENSARGQRARQDSEKWIAHSRGESETRIADSAAENDRQIEGRAREQQEGRGGDG